MAATLTSHHLDQPVVDRIRRDFASISARHTVGEALEHVQQSRPAEQIVYFYVLDEAGRLQGVLPTRGLLLNPAGTPVSEIMLPRVVKLPHTATLLDACEQFMLHRLLALPVVDDEGKMLGVIDVGLYTDEMVDLADREASNDLFQLIGVRLAQVQRASLLTVVRRRFPWLLCNIAGGIACAVLVDAYRGALEHLLVLTLFIPVVLSLAESVAIQSLSLTLQAHHAGKIDWTLVRRTLVREAPTGLFLGALAGTIMALVAWLWQRHLAVAVCVLASITLGAATAAVLGMIVPVVLRAIQRDPRVASGPIALTLADLAGLFYLLGLASMWSRG